MLPTGQNDIEKDIFDEGMEVKGFVIQCFTKQGACCATTIARQHDKVGTPKVDEGDSSSETKDYAMVQSVKRQHLEEATSASFVTNLAEFKAKRR